MRTRVGLVLVVGLLVCAYAAPAGAQSLTVTCDTPPGSRDGCNRWYTTDSVLLDWAWNPAPSSATGCEGGTFKAEGRVDRTCVVDWLGTTITKKIWIGIDRTPPALVSLQPRRPPNANGWFNRPVQLTFVGSDQTSGVASCSSTTYGGPDGAAVPISGSCSDVAGNVGAGTRPINYDSTPPKSPSVQLRPGNKRISLAWAAQSDVQAEVSRKRKGAKAVVVFRGGSDHLTDHPLHNGRRYRYVVTLTDQAGNRSADAASAVPTESPLLLPADGAHVHSVPTLVWEPVKHARYYNAQLLRGAEKVLTRWPRVAELQLSRTWTFEGRRRKLVPGHYCWYVWPGFGKRSEHRYGDLLGKSCFTKVRG